MYLHSQICVQAWKPENLTKRAENIRSEAAFFCLNCQIGYTRYGRSGRAASRWPFLLVRYFHPCSVYHHSVERMAVGLKSLPRVKIMKRQIQIRASSHLQNTLIIEHTPIYDIVAYEKRLKQRNTNQLFKKIFSAISLLCMFSVTFSILFLGE